MSAPEVSVVIPTRDRAASLGRALRSALEQRGVELEVVVVDDASGDGTPEVLERLSDPRVRALRNETPEGVSAARNRGVGAARGPWVAFLDDDDLWAPEKLRRQLDAVAAAGRRWAYGGEVVLDERLRVVDGAPPLPPEAVMAALERYDAVPGGSSSVVVAADLLARVGPFDPDLSTSEDWDMWLRLAAVGPPAWVPEPVVAVSLRAGRSATMPTMLAELEVVARRHGVRVDRPRHYRWAGWEALRDGRRWRAARYYAVAARRGDLRSIARAAVALARPGVAGRRHRPEGASGAWTARAAEWVEPLVRGGEGPW